MLVVVAVAAEPSVVVVAAAVGPLTSAVVAVAVEEAYDSHNTVLK